MQQWAIQQFRGCSIQVLAVLGRGSGFRYAYTGFICAPRDGAMSYPQMQRLHRVSADLDSADAAIAAGMREGRAIAERCFPAFLEGSRRRGRRPSDSLAHALSHRGHLAVVFLASPMSIATASRERSARGAVHVAAKALQAVHASIAKMR